MGSPMMAQDETFASEVTISPTDTLTLTPIPTDTPTPFPTPTDTPTLFPVSTDTPTEIPIVPTTEVPTSTMTSTEVLLSTADVQTTDTATSESTTSTSEIPASETSDDDDVTLTPVWTQPVEQTETLTPSPEATVETPEATTMDTTPEVTEVAETATSTVVISPTIPIEMTVYNGIVHYQNRLPDDSGIQVQALNLDQQVLSEVLTSPTGAYALTIPVNQPFIVRMMADRHRAIEIIIQAGDTPSETWLEGGDLNGDGCIGAIDLGLLTVSFEQPNSIATDITGDGITDDSDLAILAGNYTSDCESIQLPTETAVPTLQSPSDTATPLPTETLVEETAAPEVLITATPVTETLTDEPSGTVTD